jgi:hypothetical protein
MTGTENDPFADPYDGPIPEGVDEAAVERMRLVARVLDDEVAVPGTDFEVGLDPILGVLPGAGDVLAGGISLYIVLESARLGVSYTTLLEMLANVTIDVGGGMIPYVGTVVDVFWKANRRNLALALDDLAEGAAETVFADAADAAGVAPETDTGVLGAGRGGGADDDPVEIPIEVEDEP